MRKLLLALTIGVVLSGSAFAKDLPKPDADDPVLANQIVSEESGEPGKGSFSKAAEMTGAAREKAKAKETAEKEDGWERNRKGEIVRAKLDPTLEKQAADNGETFIQGQIVGYETCTKESTIALVETTDGIQRVELGPRGGRLLKLTPYGMKGTLKTDENGTYLDVSSIDYYDADPYAEYYETADKLAKARGDMAKKGVKYDRDAAYSHDNITSDQKAYLTQHAKDVDPADYTVSTAKGLKDLKAGTKVALKGRCVMTISKEKDLMEFWDTEMKRVTLHMNGLYVPLGQRCTILGVLQEDGIVEVDSMESIE